MRRFICAVAVATCVASGAVFAQDSGAKTEAKKAGEATKDAVQRKYTCVDGTTDEATLKANACKDHGGVKAAAKAKS